MMDARGKEKIYARDAKAELKAKKAALEAELQEVCEKLGETEPWKIEVDYPDGKLPPKSQWKTFRVITEVKGSQAHFVKAPDAFMAVKRYNERGGKQDLYHDSNIDDREGIVYGVDEI